MIAIAREVRVWRARAQLIPDPRIRSDALSALAHKRGHTDGAALFWTLPRARNYQLLRVLVAYEIIWDFLDSANERAAYVGQANGRQLHMALVDAVDPARSSSDYYRLHPWREDGGYLNALVAACRRACGLLPLYEHVRPLLLREALRAQVLALNHEPDPARRDTALKRWAELHLPGELEVDWFELTGAASASLTIHALFALAAEPDSGSTEIARVCAAYFPWISAATTMLDSYVDQAQDTARGDHSYIAHYGTREAAVECLRQLIHRSLSEASALANKERHVLIVTCMIAMYLSNDSARSASMRATTASLVRAGGPLTQLLLPILRLWRFAYGQCST